MDWLDLLQWPAMVVTVLAAWLVASTSKRRRRVGFWTFLLSNLLWVAWGWHDGAYALIVLQLALGAMNLRGAFQNDPKLAAMLET
jgi:hypothetical protein